VGISGVQGIGPGLLDLSTRSEGVPVVDSSPLSRHSRACARLPSVPAAAPRVAVDHFVYYPILLYTIAVRRTGITAVVSQQLSCPVPGAPVAESPTGVQTSELRIGLGGSPVRGVRYLARSF
jgi:hypothetical protein